MPARILCLVLAALTALTAAPTAAQPSAIARNSMIIDGGLSLSTMKVDAGRFTRLTLSPALSFFALDGMALGAETRFSWLGGGGQTVLSAGFGPRLTRYFARRPARQRAQVKGLLLPFVTTSFLFSHQRTTSDQRLNIGGVDVVREKTESMNRVTLSAGVGLTYMLHEAVGLFVQAAYEYDEALDADAPADTRQDTFGLFGGLTIFLPPR